MICMRRLVVELPKPIIVSLIFVSVTLPSSLKKKVRTDLNIIELTPIVIHDFDVYLKTVVGPCFNTALKTLKTFKTVIITVESPYPHPTGEHPA